MESVHSLARAKRKTRFASEKSASAKCQRKVKSFQRLKKLLGQRMPENMISFRIVRGPRILLLGLGDISIFNLSDKPALHHRHYVFLHYNTMHLEAEKLLQVTNARKHMTSLSNFFTGT